MNKDEQGQVTLETSEALIGVGALLVTLAIGYANGRLITNHKIKQAYEKGVNDTLKDFVLNKFRNENM